MFDCDLFYHPVLNDPQDGEDKFLGHWHRSVRGNRTKDDAKISSLNGPHCRWQQCCTVKRVKCAVIGKIYLRSRAVLAREHSVCTSQRSLGR
jgi:hypothetical protein